jgi:hypothetical protein
MAARFADLFLDRGHTAGGADTSIPLRISPDYFGSFPPREGGSRPVIRPFSWQREKGSSDANRKQRCT